MSLSGALKSAAGVVLLKHKAATSVLCSELSNGSRLIQRKGQGLHSDPQDGALSVLPALCALATLLSWFFLVQAGHAVPLQMLFLGLEYPSSFCLPESLSDLCHPFAHAFAVL